MDEKFIKSREAHELLRSPAFERAFAVARQSLFTQWENELEPANRDAYWYTLKALERVKLALVQEATASIQEEAKAKANQPR
jgi:hypothetical protein